jgi:hypothetical protein
MTPAEFAYTANFPTLTTPQIQAGIDSARTMWYGVITSYWASLGQTIRDAKRLLAWNLLTAWWLANQYPSAVTGVVSNGGLPLSGKTIGGVSVTFRDIPAQPGMEGLQSNVFGSEAYMMMLSAEEMYTVYG